MFSVMTNAAKAIIFRWAALRFQASVPQSEVRIILRIPPARGETKSRSPLRCGDFFVRAVPIFDVHDSGTELDKPNRGAI